MDKNIFAIIVSYEPKDSLIRLYNSIKEQVDEIVIVDNNSCNKDSVEILKKLEKDVFIIHSKQNLGIAAALNQGLKIAIDKKYKWILTLDQDSEFLPNTYNCLLTSYETLKDREKTMIIAPKAIERVSVNKNILLDSKNIIWNDAVLNLTSGSLIKAAAFDKVGLFDDKLFIEQVDNDFCYRLIRNKYKIKVAQNINFIQEIGNAKKVCGCIVRNHNSKRKYYLSRNVTIMLKRYFFVSPYTTMRYFLGGTIFGWLKVLLFEKEKIKKITCGFKGFIDGVFNIYRNIKNEI